MEDQRKLTHQEFLERQRNGRTDCEQFSGTIVKDDPLPPAKIGNLKWDLRLAELETGQSVKLSMSEDESRKSIKTIRSTVSRYKRNNKPKDFAVRLILNDEWTGIGIWRKDQHD